MKRVLMIAYHFPPCAGSSGIQRTLRFVQHLPALGWEPVILSAHRMAYERSSDDLLAQIPPDVKVVRTRALDTARHLSIGGRYPAFLARPDRWQSWRFTAVSRAVRVTQQIRFDALWSTYPIATAHWIAATVQHRTGLPWVADFRDPMAQDGYPADPLTWRSFAAIENLTIPQAKRCVFTTPGAVRMYRERFPDVPADRIQLIENGYDEESFAQAESASPAARKRSIERTVLLHSGTVYPSERDPTQLMGALSQLKRQGTVAPGRFVVRFRASEHDELLQRLARDAGVIDLIELAPPIPYREALQEMLDVDGLLVLQASNCNEQIPAKLYEYLRARNPIVALTDPSGDTAKTLAAAGVSAVAPLDSVEAIAQMLGRFVADRDGRQAWRADEASVQRASRRARAIELAKVLDASIA